MDFSIIVPTMNRPDFLLRLIRYYVALHFQGNILIGDSSAVEIFEETAQKIKKIKGRLNILHSHLPGRSVAAAVAEMNEHLETAYVCLTGDDDFIVPDSAAKCIEFLNQNLDYVAAHGKGVLITTETGTKTTLLGVSDYPQTIIHHDRASDRAAYHLEHYSVSLFSVHKAAVWRKMIELVPGEYFSYKGITFEAALTGTLQRQLHTFSGICQGMGSGLVAARWPGLNEYDSHAVIDAIYPNKLEKPTSPEMYRSHFRLLRDGLRQWMDGVVSPKGMPTYCDFVAGVTDALDHVRTTYTGNVLLVSSGGPISTAVGHVLGTSPESTIELNLCIRNVSVSEFSLESLLLSLCRSATFAATWTPLALNHGPAPMRSFAFTAGWPLAAVALR